MSENETVDEEYSIAVFEDGSKEIIPKEWIQDYLKNDETPNGYTINGNRESPQTVQSCSKENTVLLVNSNHSESTRIILENLISEVANNTVMLIKLQKSVDRLICIATGEPERKIDLCQPADSLNEFLTIEEYINLNHNYNELVSNLGKIGGKTVEATTRKIWSRLCSTRLATTICWTGANGKHCLRTMLLNNVVRDAVLITHPNGKECDVQRATMLWFSHAQDRLRTRKIE